jgi:hypothetical protein
MKNILILFIALASLVSCDNNTNIPIEKPTYLDSLIDNDSIIAVYLYMPEPKFLNEEPLRDDIVILEETMFLDSITLKWATARNAVKAIGNTFPKLIKTSHPNWDTTSKHYNELIIVGKNKIHSVYWTTSNKDSLVSIDETDYKVNKKELKKLSQLLDRRIFTKEIYKKDTVLYDLTDFYNVYNLPLQDTNRVRKDKMFIYILE